MIKLEINEIEIENLLFDPNNYRFFDIKNQVEIPYEKYSDERIQNQALANLNTRQVGLIENLEKSIKTNGYIPAEMIIVKLYELESDKYVVIEGNRRLASIRNILQEIPLNEADVELQDSLKKLPMQIYESVGDVEIDKRNELILQGIRHISGPKEWGAYQKAKLVVKLRDELDLPFTEIDSSLGLGPRITPRYYRTYKALDQMAKDSEFNELADPTLFSLFEEALKKPTLRDWLDWDLEKIDQTNEEGNEMSDFSNSENLHSFYNLIVGDPEAKLDPIITNPQQMRKLGDIFDTQKTSIIGRILNGTIDVDTAYIQAFPPEIELIDNLESCLEILEKLPIEKVRNLTAEELQLMDNLAKCIKQRKKDNIDLNK